MSYKDTADAILRDFRMSMAAMAVYKFDSAKDATECFKALEVPSWAEARHDFDFITIFTADDKERDLTL